MHVMVLGAPELPSCPNLNTGNFMQEVKAGLQGANASRAMVRPLDVTAKPDKLAAFVAELEEDIKAQQPFTGIDGILYAAGGARTQDFAQTGYNTVWDCALWLHASCVETSTAYDWCNSNCRGHADSCSSLQCWG